MASLPFPARILSLTEISADYPCYLGELEDGGAILVYSDDRRALLGVLTRDPAVFGDARLAQQIEATCRRSSSCATIRPTSRLPEPHLAGSADELDDDRPTAQALSISARRAAFRGPACGTRIEDAATMISSAPEGSARRKLPAAGLAPQL